MSLPAQADTTWWDDAPTPADQVGTKRNDAIDVTAFDEVDLLMWCTEDGPCKLVVAEHDASGALLCATERPIEFSNRVRDGNNCIACSATSGGIHHKLHEGAVSFRAWFTRTPKSAPVNIKATGHAGHA